MFICPCSVSLKIFRTATIPVPLSHSSSIASLAHGPPLNDRWSCSHCYQCSGAIGPPPFSFQSWSSVASWCLCCSWIKDEVTKLCKFGDCSALFTYLSWYLISAKVTTAAKLDEPKIAVLPSPFCSLSPAVAKWPCFCHGHHWWRQLWRHPLSGQWYYEKWAIFQCFGKKKLQIIPKTGLGFLSVGASRNITVVKYTSILMVVIWQHNKNCLGSEKTQVASQLFIRKHQIWVPHAYKECVNSTFFLINMSITNTQIFVMVRLICKTGTHP